MVSKSAPIGQPTADPSPNRYAGRSRVYNSLVTDLEDIVMVSEKRMIALMRQSLQDVIDNAQQPAAKGGRMRVDTGFLRASGQASLTGMPTGPARGDPNAKPGQYGWNGDAVVAAIGKLKMGAVLYFGWTANYAQYREIYDGFLEGALQHWQRIVTFNTDIIRERIKK